MAKKFLSDLKEAEQAGKKRTASHNDPGTTADTIAPGNWRLQTQKNKGSSREARRPATTNQS